MAVRRDNALGTTYAALIVLALFSSLEAQILTVNSCSGGINGNLDAQTTVAPQNLGNVPYAAQISNQIYTPGSNMTVTCQPLTRPAIQYQEIIIQARLASAPVDVPSTPVGTFTLVNGQPIANDPDFTVLNCNNGVSGSTVATANASVKTLPMAGLTFTYQTPDPAVGAIHFVATIVQNSTTIYERITTQAFDAVSTGGQGLAITSCPGNIVQPSYFDDEFALVSWGQPFSNGIGDVNNPPVPNDLFPVGIPRTVTYRYSRGFSTIDCTFNVLVPDLANDPPQFDMCPVNIQIFDIGGNQNIYAYDLPSCTDPNGDATSVSCDPPPLMPVPVVAQIECTCTDADGLTDACTIPAPDQDACSGNPCFPNECRVSSSSMRGYTCHGMTGTPCI